MYKKIFTIIQILLTIFLAVVFMFDALHHLFIGVPGKLELLVASFDIVLSIFEIIFAHIIIRDWKK